MAAIQKWGAARVAHYEVTGVYSAPTPLARDTPYGVADMTDRVTVAFDWDLRANALVGAATFTNGATKVGALSPGRAKECKPPTVNGPFEFFTATAIAPDAGGLSLKGTRGYPDAGVPAEYPASCALLARRAAQTDATVLVPVVSPMLALMPNGRNPNLTVAADNRSFTLRTKDWAWTYVPTIVK
jgi:hypothetical protein